MLTSNQPTPCATLHSVCSPLTCAPTPFLHLRIQRGRPPRVPDARQPQPYHALTHICTLSPHPLLSPHPSCTTTSKRICEARSQYSSGAFVGYSIVKGYRGTCLLHFHRNLPSVVYRYNILVRISNQSLVRANYTWYVPVLSSLKPTNFRVGTKKHGVLFFLMLHLVYHWFLPGKGG